MAIALDFIVDDRLDSSDEAPLRLVDMLLLPLAMAQGISGPAGDMNFPGEDTLDSSHDGPPRLLDYLLFPVAVVIAALIGVVTLVYVMLFDRLLAMTPMHAPCSVSLDTIRDALPTRDALRPSTTAAPPPMLAGSMRG